MTFGDKRNSYSTSNNKFNENSMNIQTETFEEYKDTSSALFKKKQKKQEIEDRLKELQNKYSPKRTNTKKEENIYTEITMFENVT